MGDPLDAVLRLMQDAVHFFQTLVPGGFGLLLIPLGALAIASLLAARKG